MKITAFCLIFLCTIVSARAVPPSDESILKMMKVLQLQTTLDQMAAQMEVGMKSGLQQWKQGKELTPMQTAQLGQLETRMSAIVKEELAFDKLKDIYLQVYRETFTQEEVDGINAFYSTPAGQAMVEKIPAATKKASTLLQTRMGPMIQKVKLMQQQFMKEQSEKK